MQNLSKIHLELTELFMFEEGQLKNNKQNNKQLAMQ